MWPKSHTVFFSILSFSALHKQNWLQTLFVVMNGYYHHRSFSEWWRPMMFIAGFSFSHFNDTLKTIMWFALVYFHPSPFSWLWIPSKKDWTHMRRSMHKGTWIMVRIIKKNYCDRSNFERLVGEQSCFLEESYLPKTDITIFSLSHIDLCKFFS